MIYQNKNKEEFVLKDKDLINKSLKLNNVGKYEQALEILLKFEKKYPKSSKLNGIIATTYSYMKNIEKSTIYFKKTSSLSPSSELASLGLFLGLLKLNEYKDAFNEFNRFLDAHEPKNYKVTIQELYEQIDESTPEYQRDLLEKYYNKYIDVRKKGEMK